MIPALLGILGPIIGKVIEKIPNSEERQKATQQFELALKEQETKIIELVASADKDQAETNKEEAKSTNLFVSGWRPFIGWTGGIALSYHYVLQPFLLLILNLFGKTVELPTLAIGELMPLITAMLGMGAYRMMEKKWGVASK